MSHYTSAKHFPYITYNQGAFNYLFHPYISSSLMTLDLSLMLARVPKYLHDVLFHCRRIFHIPLYILQNLDWNTIITTFHSLLFNAQHFLFLMSGCLTSVRSTELCCVSVYALSLHCTACHTFLLLTCTLVLLCATLHCVASDLHCRSHHSRWWLKGSAERHGIALPPSSPLQQGEAVEVEEETQFSRKDAKAVSSTECVYWRGTWQTARRVSVCVCVCDPNLPNSLQ